MKTTEEVLGKRVFELLQPNIDITTDIDKLVIKRYIEELQTEQRKLEDVIGNLRSEIRKKESQLDYVEELVKEYIKESEENGEESENYLSLIRLKEFYGLYEEY